MSSDDTIVAIATPAGRGGLGVVRLSGRRALEIATGLVRHSSGSFEVQRATVAQLRDEESGRDLDEVVVTFFRAPHSYTAEDVVEISCHGSPVILGHVVERSVERGARPAEPGEFTLRAFLNGRIDLTQAEAVRDLIESRTLYQARVAAQQLHGSVSARLKPHQQALLAFIARLEAGIDFAEDDVPVSTWEEIRASLLAIQADLEKLVAGFKYGRMVREGLTLAILGRPNVGKSSLFNRLLNEERAIVSATPGTTRDLVSESASIGGIPLRLVDTAGIRHTFDEVEAIGVERARRAVADADIRLMVADGSAGWTEEDAALLEEIRPLGALVLALNKQDLPQRLTPAELQRMLHSSRAAVGARHAPASTGARGFEEEDEVEAAAGPPTVWTSALTGEGIAGLRDRILAAAAPDSRAGSQGEMITNLRHQQCLQQSLAALGRAGEAARQRVPHEMLLLDLYDALHSLDAITGPTTVDDVLGVIFSTFCVGK